MTVRTHMNDSPSAAASPTTGSGFTTGLIPRARAHGGALLFVVLPTVLAMLYYFLVAADLYASEAQFVVRSPSRMQVTGLAGLLQSSGISRAQDDVFAVHDFIMSRDALAVLQDKLDLRAMFKRPEGDLLSTYPNVIYHNTFEDFFRYYRTRVAVSYDSTTGVTTLEVKAYRAEDAKEIADMLLSESEALINRLNQRAHDNAVHDAETDVQLAEQRIAQTQRDTLEYRNQESLLDPGKASGAIFENVAKMQAELANARTRLAELDRGSPGSPMRSSLETHISALAQRVEQEQVKLTGSGESMAPKISQYERLMLQQDFAAKELAAAMASLESAREDARRQQVYLERIVEPNVPDKAEFPKRIKSVLIVLISCFLGYSTIRLLLAGIREHAQT
jgi:capsular polysaccharide transport system permease protein